MITSITFRYTMPLCPTVPFADQVTELGDLHLSIAPYADVFPLTKTSESTSNTGTTMTLEIVYTPIQPAFDALFASPPTADQTKGLLRNLWTMVIATKLCTIVTEEIVVV